LLCQAAISSNDQEAVATEVMLTLLYKAKALGGKAKAKAEA